MNMADDDKAGICNSAQENQPQRGGFFFFVSTGPLMLEDEVFQVSERLQALSSNYSFFHSSLSNN